MKRVGATGPSPFSFPAWLPNEAWHKCFINVRTALGAKNGPNKRATGQHIGQLARQTSSQTASQARQQPTTRGGTAAAENNENLLAGNCVLNVALHRTLPAYPVESFRQITFFCKIFHLKTKHKAQRVARERERKSMPQSRKSPRASSRDNMKNIREKY